MTTPEQNEPQGRNEPEHLEADDYVVKPFSPTELVARIEAALRKREAPEWAEPSEP